MLILRIALFIAAAAALLVAVASSLAGFPPEAAILRGVLAFMAVSFVGYIGELVVATAPPLPRDDEARADDEPRPTTADDDHRRAA